MIMMLVHDALGHELHQFVMRDCVEVLGNVGITEGAFVRELSASGYPSHLPPATWANCRTPTVGL
jgi:hypothetical protein